MSSGVELHDQKQSSGSSGALGIKAPTIIRYVPAGFTFGRATLLHAIPNLSLTSSPVRSPLSNLTKAQNVQKNVSIINGDACLYIAYAYEILLICCLAESYMKISVPLSCLYTKYVRLAVTPCSKSLC